MIILLHGDDNYRALKKLAELTLEFRSKTNGAIIEMTPEKFTWPQFRRHRQIDGLFHDHKLIILKNLLNESPAVLWDGIDLAAELKIDQTTSVIFYERGRLDGKKNSVKTILKLATTQGKINYPEFKLPTPEERRAIIQAELGRSKKTIEPAALNELVDATSDSWQLYQEIAKLTATDSPVITLQRLRELVVSSLDDNIFHLTDALSNGDRKTSLRLLSDQLSGGAQPLYLLSMISRQVRLMIKTQAALARGLTAPANIARAVQEHPFVIQKILTAAKKIEPKRLLTALDLLLQTDAALKSSRLAPEVLLGKLICDIIN